ncbi:oxidoreductase, short chain dehydrogenase/reductase family protein [Clostridiales bacterium oral taxon 876 str. F0540]|nr:oxidoreductase, short chain dehydrogenase/reductase family protein [Clostridiales bacterium oral taxon 876 str. F0540]
MNKKVALITGSSRGIGAACAKEFAEAGYNVVIHCNSSPQKAKEVSDACISLGAEVLVFQADVSQYDECEKLVNAVFERFGRIDVLVNNAGIEANGSIMDTTLEQFDKVMKVNAYGPFYMSKLVVPHMMEKKAGSIIFMSSTSAATGASGSSAYASSKAALIGLTKTLARDLAPVGINVNAICPGPIETDMVAALPVEIKGWIKSSVAAGRLGRPEEVGAAAVFLASEKANYITGQTLTIDGIFRT